ncbi:transcriptional regulator, AraC family [Streptomyces ipomoeae 91-03]|uniref:AraC family transcriptional regulator n=2 Tax=Streptomyces ipomoeae TaxID=103232 RepID=I3P627_9ACTN|nr:AraC family transcriptional regulator [Streptomyces ipomoeae 91-03]EKX60226.1 transcriptional regulator, AraC family [Streptomyces ipomoeae 91-03]
MYADRAIDCELFVAVGIEARDRESRFPSAHVPGMFCYPFPGSRVHVKTLRASQVELVSLDCDPAVIHFNPAYLGIGEPYRQTDIYLLSGMARIRHSGRYAEIHAGHMVATCNSIDLSIEALTQCRMLVLRTDEPTHMMVKDHYEESLKVIDVERHPDGPLALSFLKTVVNEVKRANGELRASLESIVLTILGTLDNILDSEIPKRRALWQKSLLMQLKESIDRQLRVSDLRPATLAAEHHISTRQVHRVFSQTGETLMQYVKRRRLEGFASDLRDPELAHLKISEIASNWGMPDAAMLSKQFRVAYQMSPREYRKLHSLP